jgi:hypothetical protein
MVFLSSLISLVAGCSFLYLQKATAENTYYTDYDTFYNGFNKFFKQAGCFSSYGPLYCNGFDSREEVVTEMSNLISNNNLNTYKINFKPKKKLTLTSQLDFQKAYNNSPPSKLYLTFYELNAIEVLDWMLNESKNFYYIAFHTSNVKFSVNGVAPDQNECTEEILQTSHNNTHRTTFFSYFNQLEFKSSAVFDPDNPVCPFVFADAELISIGLEGLVDSDCVYYIFWRVSENVLEHFLHFDFYKPVHVNRKRTLARFEKHF